MSLHEQAARQAQIDGYKGADWVDRVNELMDAPSDKMRKIAMEDARKNTFTNRPVPGSLLADSSNWFNKTWLTKPFVPFVVTPVRLMQYSYEHSPIKIFTPGFWDTMGAGGQPREETLAKVAVGSTMVTVAWDLAGQGVITGSGAGWSKEKIRAMKATGWQEYSFLVDGEYRSYARIEPLATILGMTADMWDISDGYLNDSKAFEDTMDVIAAVIQATIGAVSSKTFAKGITDFALIVDDADRSLPQKLKNIATGIALPAYVRATVPLLGDEVVRDTVEENLWESIKSDVLKQLPWTADEVPPRLGLFGEIKTQATGFESLFPVKSSKIKNNKVYDYFADELGWSPNKPKRFIKDAKLTAWEYHDWIKYTANPAESGISEYSNITPMETELKQLIETPGFDDLSIEDRKSEVNKVVGKYRQLGREIVIEQSQRLQDEIARKNQE